MIYTEDSADKSLSNNTPIILCQGASASLATQFFSQYSIYTKSVQCGRQCRNIILGKDQAGIADNCGDFAG